MENPGTVQTTLHELLYGHDPTERIVAVHPLPDGRMRCYMRPLEGTVAHKDVPFYPFFHLADRSLMQGYTKRHWLKELAGSGYYHFLCAFDDWPSLWEAIREVLRASGRTTFTRPESYQEVTALHLITDPVIQFLMQTGITLFKGMMFNDLHRLQVDIETYTSGPHRFSSAAKPGDRITIISMADSTGWEYVIDGRKKPEEAMLQEMIALIQQRDPDVLEGHNILGFDLPYILTRCALHGIPCALGRGGEAVAPMESKSAGAEGRTEFFAVDIPGRYVVDTLQLVQNYDAVKRSMESYGLKYAAKFFGVASAERTYIEGDRISWYWDNDPATLVRYALDDVRETRAIANLLSGSTFYLAQMVPMPYDAIVRTGSAIKIESLLVRAYLRARTALPQRTEGRQQTGGYTDVFYTGLMGPIIHADVESLYPSLMLSKAIAPSSDSLGVFLQLLERLTALRLQAKHAMQAERDPIERSRFDALQGSFKILINSFYGYLGYARALFNDYAAADKVTTTGQAVLRTLMEEIRSRGGTMVEVDTDGVFFVPPAGTVGEDAEREFVSHLNGALPAGVAVAFDGRYAKMLSFRKKNYALLRHDGHMILKGSSLTSRSIEKFGRAFTAEAIQCILENDFAALHRLYLRYYQSIAERSIDIRSLARVETLRDSLAAYEEEVRSGRRNKSAAYEVAKSKNRMVRAGERIAYYITGADASVKISEQCRSIDDWNPNFPDQNVAFYQRRLDEFAERFRDFFTPPQFKEIFSPEGLFPFNPASISLQTLPAREHMGLDKSDNLNALEY